VARPVALERAIGRAFLVVPNGTVHLGPPRTGAVRPYWEIALMREATLFGESLTTVHSQFEAALPSMDSVLCYQFRKWPRRHRADALADARAACWHAWSGLIRRGKDPLAIGPTGIAAYAARYVKNGRQFGCGTSGRGNMDVYHPRAQRDGLKLISLDRDFEPDAGAQTDVWREWLAEDNRTTPADEAAFRIDFSTWLASLPERKRQMAELLAEGNGTGDVARLLGVTPPAVSLTRTWLEASWRTFQDGVAHKDNEPALSSQAEPGRRAHRSVPGRRHLLEKVS
jgi:hypothetical protein